MGKITEHFEKFNYWYKPNNGIQICDELRKNNEEGKNRNISSKKKLKVYTLDGSTPNNEQFVKLKTTINQYSDELPPFNVTEFELMMVDENSVTGYKNRNIYLCQGFSYGCCSTVFVLDMNTLTLKELKYFDILPAFYNNGIWDDNIYYLIQYMNCSNLTLDDYLEWGDGTYNIWFDFFVKLISVEPDFLKFSYRFFSKTQERKIKKAVRMLKLKYVLT